MRNTTSSYSQALSKAAKYADLARERLEDDTSKWAEVQSTAAVAQAYAALALAAAQRDSARPPGGVMEWSS